MTLPLPRNAVSPFDQANLGQLNFTFSFKLIVAATGAFVRWLTPLADTVPQLSHDTSQTIKRRVNISFGVSDTAAIDTIKHRILIFMVLANGTTYPLGRYMFTDNTRVPSTGGRQSSMMLMDEEFILDQPSQTSFPPANISVRNANLSNNATVPISVSDLINVVLLTQPNLTAVIDETDFFTSNAWSIGTSSMQTLTDLATFGDFFPPWMDNTGTFRMIRSFDPASVTPRFDWDTYPHVYADSVTESDDLLTAPNRFIVISNAAGDASDPTTTGPANSNTSGAIFGSYDIPSSAPNSIDNRGFVVPVIVQAQLDTQPQATAVARSLGLQSTLYQRTTLTTFPDPRHDSYDVVKWQGSRWLELAWSMDLIAGGGMTHTLRKVYLT